MFTLDALEKALASVEQLGQSEKTYQVGGTSVTLRVLTQEEEIEVQGYAGEVLQAGEESTNQVAMEYIVRFKVGVLSYALIQVGPNNFRGLDYVETGDVLESGVKVKIPKHQALRKLLRKWSATLIHGIFRRYAELAAEAEIRADKALRFEPVDLDTEIERVEKRLSALKTEKDQRTQGDKERAGIYDAVQRFANMDEAASAEPEPPPPAAPVAQPRRPAVPERAAPPPAPAPRSVAPAMPVVRTPDPEPEEEEFTEVPPQDLLPEFQDSFVSDDPESLAQEIARENARLVAARRGMQHQVADAAASVLSAAHQQGLGRRAPPHRAAAQVEQEIMEPRRMEHIGNIGDAPVFRDEPQDLSIPVPRRAPDQRNTVVNQAPNDKSRNPRFVRSPRP